MRRRPGRTAAAVTVATTAVVAAVDPSARDVAIVAGLGALRVTRVAIAGTQMAIDYKWLGKRDRAEDKEAWDRAQQAVHQRGADRLLRLFSANGGIYIKSGQYLASLGNAIPREYIATLSVLQDRAPHQPFSEVRRLFRQETGREPESFFRLIEEEPIASASLAQVHRAYTFDGQKVAVKVQYPDVSRLYETDLWAMATVARITALLFENVDLKWMVEEFKVNVRAGEGERLGGAGREKGGWAARGKGRVGGVAKRRGRGSDVRLVVIITTVHSCAARSTLSTRARTPSASASCSPIAMTSR